MRTASTGHESSGLVGPGERGKRASSCRRASVALARILVTVCPVCLVLGCATSPLGRRQLKLYSSGSMTKLGLQSFDKLKRDLRQSHDARKIAYVRCVALTVVAAVEPGGDAPANWEVVVFEDATANAFALPGGKIGVHTGLLDVATTPDQLAAVIGHEVGHVLAGHANERMSQTQLSQVGLVVASAFMQQGGGLSPAERKALGLLGVGAQYGVLLPYSRTHESEADVIGLQLMARAGFDPEQSVDLWRNMARAGREPPEILSTHPSHESRIRVLRSHMIEALALREEARRAGRRPACTPSGESALLVGRSSLLLGRL